MTLKTSWNGLIEFGKCLRTGSQYLSCCILSLVHAAAPGNYSQGSEEWNSGLDVAADLLSQSLKSSALTQDHLQVWNTVRAYSTLSANSTGANWNSLRVCSPPLSCPHPRLAWKAVYWLVVAKVTLSVFPPNLATSGMVTGQTAAFDCAFRSRASFVGWTVHHHTCRAGCGVCTRTYLSSSNLKDIDCPQSPKMNLGWDLVHRIVTWVLKRKAAK